MSSDILLTKLRQPPTPSRHVERTRIIQYLNDGLSAGRRLTLVSAPAGFGKTTCVSEWVNCLHRPVSWLLLDRADDDPARFFTYLIAALQKVDRNAGCEIEAVLHAGQLPPLSVIATSLINDITEMRQFLLVLDDLQVIQDRGILEVLESLLANQPEQMHLVLITREDPLLPLSRLRANNQMTELRAGDLRFSDQDANLFLNEVMGLSLSEADVALLENRTEGWAAGLQLAGLSMRGQADLSGFITRFSGSHRYILNYLTEEVLSRQSEDIQLFLLQTAILERLCGDLCDALTGRMDSRDLLEKLFNANLFLIPLDEENRWYRYHHLFRDLLLNRQSQIPRKDILQLHRRASRWYEEAGFSSEAIDHALSAEDYVHVVQLLEEHASGMIKQGYMKTVEGWMQALPSEWHLHSPRANLAFALMHLLRGSYDKVMPYLEQAEQAIMGIEDSGEEMKSLRAEYLALKANLLNAQEKAEQGLDLADQALQCAGMEDDHVRCLAYAALGGSYRLKDDYAGSVEAYQQAIRYSQACGDMASEILSVTGLMAMALRHGQLHMAHKVGSQALDRLEREEVVRSSMTGAIHGLLGLPCYEWDQIEKAREHLLHAIHLSSLSGHSAAVGYARIWLSRVLQAQGDYEAAGRTVREATDQMTMGIPAWLKPEMAVLLVRFYLAEGNPAAGEAALNQLGLSLPADPYTLHDPLPPSEEQSCIACLLLRLHKARAKQQREELQPGIDLAGRLVAGALRSQRVGTALQALLLRSEMYAYQGKTEASLDDLRQALELAQPEGYIRTFVDEGQTIDSLLGLYLEQPVKNDQRQVDFIKQIRAAFTTPGFPATAEGAAPTPASRAVQESLIEPLTGRELDVLRLIAEGYKYEEIAERLVITLNTVRFYVKEIYSKLGVNNRTRAVETARLLGLL
ncbi:MAG: LuxR C-terminal-related transcriptional regulator [Omnitrophica WOR_2 bacterium]